MNKFITVTGPSGVGKTFTVAKMLERYPGEFIEATSTTTRAPREGEKHGEDYFYVSPNRFQELLDAEALLEHVDYNGKQYGVERQEVERCLEAANCFIVVEVAGAEQIRDRWNGPLLQIYLQPPSEETLRERMAMRGSSPGEIEERIKHDRAHFGDALGTHGSLWTHIVESGDIDDVTDQLYRIIT